MKSRTLRQLQECAYENSLGRRLPEGTLLLRVAWPGHKVIEMAVTKKEMALLRKESFRLCMSVSKLLQMRPVSATALEVAAMTGEPVPTGLVAAVRRKHRVQDARSTRRK